MFAHTLVDSTIHRSIIYDRQLFSANKNYLLAVLSCNLSAQLHTNLIERINTTKNFVENSQALKHSCNYAQSRAALLLWLDYLTTFNLKLSVVLYATLNSYLAKAQCIADMENGGLSDVQITASVAVLDETRNIVNKIMYDVDDNLKSVKLAAETGRGGHLFTGENLAPKMAKILVAVKQLLADYSKKHGDIEEARKFAILFEPLVEVISIAYSSAPMNVDWTIGYAYNICLYFDLKRIRRLLAQN